MVHTHHSVYIYILDKCSYNILYKNVHVINLMLKVYFFLYFICLHEGVTLLALGFDSVLSNVN